MTPAIHHDNLPARQEQQELASAFMPVMAMAQAIQRYNALLDFTKQIMKEGKDYGTIPGVEKPSLFKPGAEKLCNFFGLTPRFVVVKELEQWDGEEPFFYYWYKCQLWRGSVLIAEGDGSCNSRETKYRYRWVAEDQIPSHLNKAKLMFRAGKATEPDFAIEKAETGGKYGKPMAYWQSFRDAIQNGTAVQGTKKSSTGRDMKTWSIESTVYRIPNPEISDVVNTIQKMSQKRALVAVTLIGCNASEYYTQDIEDMDSINVPYTVVQQQTPSQVAERKINGMKEGKRYADVSDVPADFGPPADFPSEPTPPPVEVETAEASIKARLAQFAKIKSAMGDPEYYKILGTHGYEHANQIRNLSEARAIYREMQEAFQYQQTRGAV